MIIKKNKGGGLAINPNHIFADSTARDAYFALHPTELVKGTFISVGTDYEEYDGVAFSEKTAIITGPAGNAGSIQVGTVTTLPAGSSVTVVNVGTTNSAIFDFGIPKGADGAGGGSATWGGITGTLSAQTDLNSALSGKQATLVSGTNIKTINGTSVLGSGNIVISGGGGGGAVDLVNGQTGVVTLNQDEIPDGATYKQYSQTEKTKLAGIATGAQVNTSKVKASATDTTEGYLGDKLVAGTNVTITKNNSGADETYTIASTGGGGSGVTVYADLATIKAVDTTAITSGTLAQVVTLGLYEFISTSTMTGDDINVIVPTTGGGRWILQTFTIEEVATSASKAWSTTTRNPTINNRLVKTIKKDATKVRVVAIGSSVMAGQELANPETESYVALLSTDLGANYTFFNNSIGGNTTALGYARFDKDVAGFNPDIVILGFSPNNNALGEATTQGGCDSAIISYLKNLLLMIRECENRGYDYIIMGVYPKNSYTAIANKALKSLNIRLSEIFGAKYINILGQLEDGYSKIRSGFYTLDGIHFTSMAHIYIKNCIPYNLFDYLSKTKNKFELNKENGLNLGSDVVTAYPLKTNSNHLLNRVRSWSVGADINLKGNSITGKTLMLFESSNPTYSVKLIANSSGNLEFQYLGASALTTTTKLKSTGWNRIIVVFDKPFQRFKLYVDGSYIGQTTLIDFNHQYVVWGGDGIATNNCVNAEFRNLSRWILPLTAEEVVADFNKILIYGGLDEFYPLKDVRSCYVNLAINSNMTLDLNSTTASISNETDNNFTDAEKEKVTAVNAVGVAVASATTITVPANKTIFHITGTATISTVNLPYTGFTGKISIIPDGVFTFDTAGNIAETYTATVNRCIDLVYDGTKWYRVNS